MHAIYIRVSTDEQAQKGYSLESQLTACKAKAASLGLFGEAREYIDDGFSGAFLERPALSQLRNLLAEHKIDAVIAYDPDRLARELEHILLLDREINHARARLFFVTGDYEASPTGKLFFAMRGAFAAYERALIRERTSRGRRQKAVKGKIVSNAHPYGYGFDAENSMYVIDKDQAEVVRLIYDLCIEKSLGSRAIARELRDRGIVGPRGTPLSPITVHKILSREMYCGQHYQFRQQARKVGQNKRVITNNPREEWLPVSIPLIVTRMVWEKAQQQLKRNKNQARRNCQRDYLLKGTIYCGLCGRAMMATTRVNKSGTPGAKPYSYYTCVTRESPHYALKTEKCPAIRIPADQMDRAVWDVFTALVCNSSALADYLAAANLSEYALELARLSERQDELLKRHRQIAALIREGLLDIEAARKELSSANRELRAIKKELHEVSEAKAKLERVSESSPLSGILSAVTPKQEHEMIIRSGIRVFASRKERECIQFYLAFNAKSEAENK